MQGASAHLLPDFHGNRGSPGAVALGADTASHTVCKFLYNAKSQSVSRLSALCRIAHIRIKSLPQLFACHSGAGVRHPAADHHIRGIPDCLTGNHTADLALLCELDRICEQILQNFPDAHGIPIHFLREFSLYTGLKPHPLRLQIDDTHVCHLLEHLIQPVALRHQLELSCLNSGIVKNRIHLFHKAVPSSLDVKQECTVTCREFLAAA